MLRMRSRNSAGRSSSARATSRAKRACRRRDTFATLAVALGGLLLLTERGSKAPERTSANATDARFRKPDLQADLAQGQPASVRQHDHVALQLRKSAELARDKVPARIAADPFGDDRIGRGETAVAELGQAVERDLDVGGWEVLRDALRLAVGAPGGAGERVALAQRVEHLTAHPSGGVRGERCAQVAAVSLGGLHQADDAPGDQVL